ncbi:hemagglutinin repeat-containing protein [Salinispirillum sp. LH 10-3-1]|uniref:Hemagglutinin repeat-containing protein n=1 Tax=Salinispirillum sp. LH 10-3-1 TaxID=2952525 RepID=A0AB38YHR9_9GAMM
MVLVTTPAIIGIAKTVQKRLGDGFYEQQMVREQIITQTGQRFLGNNNNDEEQYRNLMNAGVTFAQAHQLRPGIALTASQVAALTTDIVWLVEQQVALPDGRIETVLVPRVYTVVRDGDLDIGGTLLAGRNVEIDLEGDLTNSGTILAKETLQIDADNLHNNGGDIGGSRVFITTEEDLNVTGGRVVAENVMVLDVGNDLNVITTVAHGSGGSTEQNSSGTFAGFTATRTTTATYTSTEIGQQAGLYVTSEQGQMVARAEASDEIGTQISSGGNAAFVAGNDFHARAAEVQADGTLYVQAEGDVLVGGQQATFVNETETETEVTSLTVGVRNAYVDAYNAAANVNSAYKAVERANSALKEAERRFERGEITESALRDYKINHATAVAGLAQAQIAAGTTIASAATSAATGGTGFYASVNAEVSHSSSYSQSTQGVWQGSSIQAGSLTVSGENATFQGSDIAAGLASLNSTNTSFTAGVNTSSTQTESSSVNASMSYSTRSNVGLSGSAGANAATSSSDSTQYVNSRLNVGHLESNSDTFSLIGAELQAQTANMDVGNLHIESLQDTHRSANGSIGGNVGVGSSGVNSIGVNAGMGSSNGNQVGNQTQLLIADGANSQITADHTNLVGGLVANATRNENGELVDHGQLNLTTNTLSVSDLDNRSSNQQVGTNMNFGQSSTTVGAQNAGHITEGQTQATLGLGNVQVGGETLDDSNAPANLNRDIADAHITTRDQQTGGLDASATLEYSQLTVEGWSTIIDDQLSLASNTLTAANGAGRDVQLVGNAVGEGVHIISGGNENVENIIGFGGLIPTTLNNGGLMNQAPILLGADDINQRNMVVVSSDSDYVKANPELGWVSIEEMPGYSFLSPAKQAELAGIMVSTSTLDITPETSTFQNATNGIRNTESAAIFNGMTQTHDLLNGDPDQEILFTQNYNPTRGMVADLAESGVDALVNLTGWSFLSTSVARQTGQFMSDVAEAQGENGANFAHHSQANLLAYSGLLANVGNNNTANVDFDIQNTNITYASYGSPVNSLDLNRILSPAGIQLNVSSTNPGDFVGEVLGGNYGVYIKDLVGGQVNIVTHEDGGMNQFVYSQAPVVDLPTISTPAPGNNGSNIDKLFNLFSSGSPHSNYNCLGAQCGAQPQETQ